MKTWAFVFMIFAISKVSIAQEQDSKYAHLKFSADTVSFAIDDITRELSLKQPGFYRYSSKDEFRKFNDSIKSSLGDSMSELESYQKLKAVVSKIHCLHTGINLPLEYKDYLNTQPNLIPLQLWFKGRKAFIVKNYSDNHSISPGDEILSINGRMIESITDQLLLLIPSDGFNMTMKYRALYLQFPTWYRVLDPANNFLVRINQRGTAIDLVLRAAKFKELAIDGFLKEPEFPKQLEFGIVNQTGILVIHTFAKTTIEKSGQHFKSFIQNVFGELKDNHIEKLIVDLRDNTGGSDPYAAYFTSYFFDKPFRYWDRIEVTEAIARQIKGFALKAFYRVPVQKDSVWLWQKAKHTDEFDFYTEQLPAKNHFTGKVFILINGFCMSSCADVTAILSYNNKAVFIGEETGGAFEGNNSGMMPETLIDPFHFKLTVPLQSYYNYVNDQTHRGRGTIPEYDVNPGIQEILAGRDLEMARAWELVKSTP